MKRRSTVVSSLFLGFFGSLVSHADTPVSGVISTNTTWTLAGSPYVVTGQVFVEGASTPVLTIQAGVTVKFNSIAELFISYNAPGVLQAVGTSASPILFTANGSTTSGFWRGLYVGNKVTATPSRISYATVEYGGMTTTSRGGIHVRAVSPTFDNLTLRNNLIAGLSVDGGSPAISLSTLTTNTGSGVRVAAGSPSITSCTISSNSGYGIDVLGGSPTISSDTITSNTNYAISALPSASLSGLTGLTVSGNGPGKDAIEWRAGTISANQTWLATTVPYVVTGQDFSRRRARHGRIPGMGRPGGCFAPITIIIMATAQAYEDWAWDQYCQENPCDPDCLESGDSCA